MDGSKGNQKEPHHFLLGPAILRHMLLLFRVAVEARSSWSSSSHFALPCWRRSDATGTPTGWALCRHTTRRPLIFGSRVM